MGKHATTKSSYPTKIKVLKQIKTRHETYITYSMGIKCRRKQVSKFRNHINVIPLRNVCKNGKKYHMLPCLMEMKNV